MRFLPRWLTASGSKLPSEITLSVPVELTAAQGEAGGLPTFSIQAYDGSAMRLPNFFCPVIIDLKGAKAKKPVKVLREHDINRVVGHSTKVRIDATGIFIDGIVSGTGADALEVVASSKNQFPWEASVGASIDRLEFLEAGKTAKVNARDWTGPAYIARQSTTKEISFVVIGAADKTTVDVTASDTDKDVTTMNFEQWLKASGFEPSTLTDAQRATLKASFDAEQLRIAAPGGTPAPNGHSAQVHASGNGTEANPAQVQVQLNAGEIIAQINANAVRTHEINQLCAAAGNPTMELTAGGARVSIAAHAIVNNWTRDITELHVLRASRPQAPNIITGRSSSVNNAQAIEAALCRSAGMNSEFIESHFDEAVLEASESRQLRQMGVQQLIHMSILANGGHAPMGRLDNMAIEAALRLDPMLNGSMLRASGMMGGMSASDIQASGFSTISLSGILSNLANKAMLERFESIESVVNEIAFQTDTNDFKPFTRYRLDGSGVFSEVGTDGELKHIGLAESTYSNQLKTYGGMIALTRQMIRNDDLGAFLQIPAIFAEMAMHLREKMLMTLILANAGSFFGTGNGNYQEGADTVLSIESLSAALALFRSMKNAGGNFIMQSPRKLLVPPALEALAGQIHTSTQLNETTTANKPKAVDNPHKGAFKPVQSPYLGTASGLTNASNTGFYLLPEPTAGRAIAQVGYLAGQRTPIVESAEANFSTLGMEWRSYWDFGVAMFEKLAGVFSKGAA